MYYNTNNETGLTLSDSWVKSAQQNELILRLFMDNVNQVFTPDEILHLCEVCEKNWPITSIRRAISTLTDQGKLTKTNELREGRYGKKEHVWHCNREGYTPQIRNDINDTDTPGQGSNGF